MRGSLVRRVVPAAVALSLLVLRPLLQGPAAMAVAAGTTTPKGRAPGASGSSSGSGAYRAEPPQEAADFDASHTLGPDELVRRRARGDSVLLRSVVFDPVNEPLPKFAAGRTVTGSEKTFLVQFRRDLSATELNHLEQTGIRFVDTIPSHAYLVRASSSAVAALRADPLFRWLDAFRGGYKLASILRSPTWPQDLHLDLRLLPGENPVDLLARARARDPAIAFETVLGDVAKGATLRVLVPAGHLHPFVELAAEDDAVWTIDPWYLPRIMNDNSIWVIQSYDTTNKLNYALSATLWNHGITGTGQTPAIADTGLDDDMCFFRNSASPADVTDAQSPALPGTGMVDPTKKVAAYYVLPSATAYDGNTSCSGFPESYHGTHTSGSIVGDNYLTLSTPTSGGHDNGDGMAPNAKLIFQDIGSELSGCLEGLTNDYHLIWKQAYDAGARIHSNSWGASASGAYTGDSRVIDEIMYDDEDLLIVFANGNAGPGVQTVVAPATAKNCLSVGATSNGSAGANFVVSFSGRGPTADGRIKPDIVAPGFSVVSASGDASHTSNNCGIKALSGTSMATPTVAGGATLLRQYFTDGFYPTGAKTPADAMGPSAALLKAALINGAVETSATSQATMLNALNPDFTQGFGRIELDNVAFFSTPVRDVRRTRVWDKWNATGLATGQVDDYTLQVQAGQPLKVTLAWTDPEASGLSTTTLVNNLDLEVIDPSSNVYRGNVFSGGQSVTGGTADLLNPVEEVFLTSPAAGTWTLRVKGTAVPGAPSHASSDRQGYALVATYADCTVTLAAPAGLVATDNGATGIDLSWSAVPGAAGYQIYRAAGSCAAAPTAYHFLGRTTATSFTDTLAQGGYGYAYRVRAVTDCTEGALGACAAASYSGNCTLAPAFDGLASGDNDLATPACDTLLGWSAASSSCPLTPGVSYDVYRSTDPYFTPGPAALIAAGTTGTSYRDSSVTPNTTYYYTVHAEDGSAANGGAANGGNEDTNRAVKVVTPTSASTYPGTWSDDGGDVTARLALDSPWVVSHQMNHTSDGNLAYHSAPDGLTYPAHTCGAATTPAIALQAGQSPVLSYWARYDLEYQWDGVVVEISTNGGGSWTTLNPSPPYPSTLAQTGASPLNACGYASTQGAFTGPNPNGALSPWTQYTSDLTAYAGQSVMIRWRFSSDRARNTKGSTSTTSRSRTRWCPPRAART